MKAWIFSDLHLEHDSNLRFAAVPDADICICAGDLIEGGPKASLAWLAEFVAPYMPVLYIPGVQDFYRSSIVEGLKEASEFAERHENIFLLDGAYFALNGYQFIGATLWTDFNSYWDAAMAKAVARKELEEYRKIKMSKKPLRKFTPQGRFGLHAQALVQLMGATWDTQNEHRIIISHHAPSLMSIPRDILGSPLAGSLASRLENRILEYDPILWVHGHIHAPSNYLIGNTRVICNPLGFVGEQSRRTFVPDLVIDLAKLADAAKRRAREKNLFETIREPSSTKIWANSVSSEEGF